MHRGISVLSTTGIGSLVVLVESFVLELVWCTLGFVVEAARSAARRPQYLDMACLIPVCSLPEEAEVKFQSQYD